MLWDVKLPTRVHNFAVVMTPPPPGLARTQRITAGGRRTLEMAFEEVAG